MELVQLPKKYSRICEHVFDYYHGEDNIARHLEMIMVDYLKEELSIMCVKMLLKKTRKIKIIHI